MSKTLNNHIELASSPEEILERVMTMVTDPARRYRTDPGNPDICNVFTLHRHLSPDDAPQIETDCRNATIGCVEHKKWFAKDLAHYLAPFRARRAEFAADPNYVWEVLADGAERAQAIARVTIAEVKGRIGLP
jgi:tryptophanyl-tRNA synthetase